MVFITQEETHDTIYHHMHISPKHIIIAVIVVGTIIGAGVWFASGMSIGSKAALSNWEQEHECRVHQAACGRESGLSRPKGSHGINDPLPKACGDTGKEQCTSWSEYNKKTQEQAQEQPIIGEQLGTAYNDNTYEITYKGIVYVCSVKGCGDGSTGAQIDPEIEKKLIDALKKQTNGQ